LLTCSPSSDRTAVGDAAVAMHDTERLFEIARHAYLSEHR
jgi:hypothetical protein